MERVLVTLIDDLDGTSAAQETITFGLDDKLYEIDLSSENAARLREALRPWVKVARPSSARIGKADSSESNRVDPAKVRRWALERGQQVSERGRLPKGLIRDYLKAVQNSSDQ